MLKLLQINVSANWGSTGKIAEQIGQNVIDHDWESYIAYSRYANNSTSNLIKIGNKFDLLFHVLISRLFDIAGEGAFFSTKKLIKRIKEIKPDVIQLHNIHGYVINYRLLFNYLKLTDVKVVWTFHDCWAFTGHCAYFELAKCDKWETLCESCPLKRSYPKSILFDNSRKNYLRKKRYFNSVKNLVIVPVSVWLSDLVDKSFLCGFPKQVIHNGVDTNVFKYYPSDIRRKYHIPEKKPIILGVASVWDERKGLADFTVLSKNSDYQIILVGITQQQQKTLPQNIIAVARTQNQTELAQYYSIANVFVNPTYNDTFPTTNLEALSCGTPVVTYKTGGSPEAVDSDTGIVVEKGAIKQLDKAIRTVIGAGKDFYMQKCRNRAVENFSLDCYKQYYELYTKLLEDRV